MKNFLKKFAAVLVLINIALTIQMAVANAADPKSIDACAQTAKAPLEYLKCIGDQSKLPNYVDTGVHPDAAIEVKPGVATVTSPIYFAIDMFRYVISTIAFVYVIVSALKLISTVNEEEATKVKEGLVMGIIGFIIIQLADFAVKKAFFGEQGEAFQDVATTKLYAEETVNQIRGIVGFFEVFFGAIAVLVLVIRGFTLITSGGDEEQLGKAKKHVIYALAGLVVVGLAEVVVRGFIFPEQGSELPNVEVGKRLIVSITNFLAGFVSILSFIMLFYSGFLYVTSGGNEEVHEKVKKIIFGAVMALVLAMGAFAAVNTFVKFGSPDNPSSSTDPVTSTTNTPE